MLQTSFPGCSGQKTKNETIGCINNNVNLVRIDHLSRNKYSNPSINLKDDIDTGVVPLLSHLELLKVRAAAFLRHFDDTDGIQKEEMIDSLTATNFNHLIEDITNYIPDLKGSLPDKIRSENLQDPPVTCSQLEKNIQDVIQILEQIECD